MNKLYADHIDHKLAIYRTVFENTPWRKIVIHSGSEHMQFLDDLPYPFKVNPYFKEWLPLLDHPEAYLLIEAQGNGPRLLLKQVDDYWHSPAEPPGADITAAFEIDYYQTAQQLQRQLGVDATTAVIGENGDGELPLTAPQYNNADVLHIVDYHRAGKSAYEISCMAAANQLAVEGHRAAEQAFYRGDSEYAIHQAYLVATKQTENELPYNNICALNEHAAVLHHMHLSKRAPGVMRSFLIDAGAGHAGYAADITRTYQAQEQTVDGDFSALLSGVETCQQRLAQDCLPGADYVDLHNSMHGMLTRLLCDMEVFKVSVDEAQAKSLSSAFCPHGLGHLIGVQVHDRGGHQCGRQGQLRPPPAQYPALRCTRTLTENMVVTVEPGAYFIPSLLEPLRHTQAEAINWPLVDKLIPFGGVRIEDNVVVTSNRARNLTREAFAALGT
ncbi:Xaa-Pro dipeptidase [Exilibacterium tricleocarpae]|uniref:Xaa-Pro dipeptidase n=1 Tax=Exilibacterium tricleocarpae TaxID=2591008 RepID=A0A545SQJ3_9GAMM|nr:Xaa-Pro dipeptidase [Exilibacterium tricleocarpae]TQV67250.1 Xaa-Pro dipeptidase [Exilibacterium tricleocarpae]